MRFSNTRRRLWECFALVLLAIGVSTASGMWLHHRTSEVESSIRERVGPMVVDLSVARRALYSANDAVTASFLDGRARLAGPGKDFYNQVAIATQSLAQATPARDETSERTSMRTVDGLLASYMDGISQAGAHARAGDDALAAAALWNSWRLLDGPGGIMDKLDELTEVQAREAGLSRRADQADPRMFWPIVFATASAVLLLAILLLSQRMFRRRFRRLINPGLLAATALTSLLVVLGGLLVMATAERTAAAKELIAPVVADRSGTSPGLEALAELVRRQCGEQCGPTVTESLRRHRFGAPESQEEYDRAVRRKLDERQPQDWQDLLLPLGGLAVAASAVTGFWPRFSEYRFEKVR